MRNAGQCKHLYFEFSPENHSLGAGAPLKQSLILVPPGERASLSGKVPQTHVTQHGSVSLLQVETASCLRMGPVWLWFSSLLHDFRKHLNGSIYFGNNGKKTKEAGHNLREYEHSNYYSHWEDNFQYNTFIDFNPDKLHHCIQGIIC